MSSISSRTSRIDSAGDPIGFDLKYTVVNYLTLLGISGVINKKSPLIFSDGPWWCCGCSCGDLVFRSWLHCIQWNLGRGCCTCSTSELWSTEFYCIRGKRERNTQVIPLESRIISRNKGFRWTHWPPAGIKNISHTMEKFFSIWDKVLFVLTTLWLTYVPCDIFFTSDEFPIYSLEISHEIHRAIIEIFLGWIFLILIPWGLIMFLGIYILYLSLPTHANRALKFRNESKEHLERSPNGSSQLSLFICASEPKTVSASSSWTETAVPP